MTIRLMIRGYLGRTLQFRQPLSVEEREIDTVVATLGEQHAAAMASGALGMVEIEFLDEPDFNQRFYRIGVDPSGMVMPLEINLGHKARKPD